MAVPPKDKPILFFLITGMAVLFWCVINPQISYAQATTVGTDTVQASKDTAKVLIHVLNNDYGEFIKSDGRAVQKLMYHVKLRYGSDTMYCDSAFFYVNTNSVEAFGDVAIYEADGTRAFAEYMRYTSQDAMVYMRSRNSDVELADSAGNTLWSKEIYYNLKTKIGYYNHGGTLQSGKTIVNSLMGTYHLKTKDARFKKKVEVSNPQYDVHSDDLGYNTETKVVSFFGHSEVTNNQSILKTTAGTYNTLDSTSHFTKRTAIWNGSQFIEADTLDYNHSDGLSKAKGKVIAMDTAQGLTLFSEYARYNEKSSRLWAYGAPLLRTIHGEDTLYLKADTFFSAVAPDSLLPKKDTLPAHESLQQTADRIQLETYSAEDSLGQEIKPSSRDSSQSESGNKAISDTAVHKVVLSMDSMALTVSRQQHFDSLRNSYQNRPERSDTAPLRYFIGYHHVRLFSDSLQGRCDSIRYSQVDSLLRMYVHPLLWPNNSQVAGDVIYLKMDSSRLRELIVPKNGILINRSGPKKAGMFNQIQGDAIHGYFKNNQLKRLVATPHAKSIYYVVNDAGEYVGCSKASSREIVILFDSTGNQVQRIYYRQNVKQKMTPMKDVQPETMHLSRFKWQADKRPKNLADFLKGVSQPHAATWQ